jgi:hypothetical protein
MIKLDLIGVNETNQWLAVQVKKITMKTWEAAKEAALVIMDTAKRNTPVLTNRLRSSIHVETQGDGSYNYSDRKGQSFDGTFSETPGKNEIFVGTNVEYGPKVEKRSHYMRKGLRAGKLYLNKKLRDI